MLTNAASIQSVLITAYFFQQLSVSSAVTGIYALNVGDQWAISEQTIPISVFTVKRFNLLQNPRQNVKCTDASNTADVKTDMEVALLNPIKQTQVHPSVRSKNTVFILFEQRLPQI